LLLEPYDAGLSPVKPSAVRFEGVHKSFDGRVALEELSFEIGEKEFVSVVGPSGCGKSTNLRILAGLVPPTGGSVVVRDKEVRHPIFDAAMVFQSLVLLPWRRAFDNVLFNAEMAGGRQPTSARADALMHLAGLDGFERSYPPSSRAACSSGSPLCRALLLDPPLLLMDEPFGSLDVLTRERMGFELQRIREATWNTVVFVTHGIQESVLLSDRVLVLSGRPGREKAVIPVDLPRPRTAATLEGRRIELSRNRVAHDGHAGREIGTPVFRAMGDERQAAEIRVLALVDHFLHRTARHLARRNGVLLREGEALDDFLGGAAESEPEVPLRGEKVRDHRHSAAGEVLEQENGQAPFRLETLLDRGELPPRAHRAPNALEHLRTRSSASRRNWRRSRSTRRILACAGSRIVVPHAKGAVP
jgi:NitT/TauT family transport system ATP-binding protein